MILQRHVKCALASKHTVGCHWDRSFPSEKKKKKTFPGHNCFNMPLPQQGTLAQKQSPARTRALHACSCVLSCCVKSCMKAPCFNHLEDIARTKPGVFQFVWAQVKILVLDIFGYSLFASFCNIIFNISSADSREFVLCTRVAWRFLRNAIVGGDRLGMTAPKNDPKFRPDACWQCWLHWIEWPGFLGICETKQRQQVPTSLYELWAPRLEAKLAAARHSFALPKCPCVGLRESLGLSERPRH